jgi:hypothetical protein
MPRHRQHCAVVHAQHPLFDQRLTVAYSHFFVAAAFGDLTSIRGSCQRLGIGREHGGGVFAVRHIPKHEATVFY